MLAQAAHSSFFDLFQKVDPDFLGVMGILTTVFTFVFLMVAISTISRTIQNISIARMQNQMINELLAKGYSVQDIQQLVHGSRKNVLFRFFDNNRQTYVNRQPSPPVKNNQTA